MPPQFIFDIAGIDLDHVLFTKEQIREVNPQRGAMEMLDGIVYCDEQTQRIIGYKDTREDEFWVPGHIPGRPLFPGVMMIEAGAQLASFYTIKIIKWAGFIGFGGVEDVRFRMQVPPGKRLYLLAELKWHRHGRICCLVQGMLEGNVVFEATVIGVKM